MIYVLPHTWSRGLSLNMAQGTANENAASIRRICKRSNQLKIKMSNSMQGSYWVENLTRQRHDGDQTENQQNAATVDSCFELVGSRQHGVAQHKIEQQTRGQLSTKYTW